MKRTLSILMMLFVTAALYAQETSKKEIGLVFGSFDNFGATFRIGNGNSYWRFSSLVLGGSNQTEESDDRLTKVSGSSFKFSAGKEFRKPINEKFAFRFGADASFTYFNAKTEVDDKSGLDEDYSQKRTAYTPGVNLVLGLSYKLGENFILGAELLPSIQYSTGKTELEMNNETTKSDNSGFSYGLTSGSALLSIVYLF